MENLTSKPDPSRAPPSGGVRPEILAPAGSPEALRAALAAGADAVYFGLDGGFNARARATNFPVETLAKTVDLVHRAAAKAYVTFNTLVFEPELEACAALIRAAATASVDALIVQDPAVALIAREICPQLEVHASTQMTISSPEASRFAEWLGVTRVVLPRELSVEEIGQFVQGSHLETEVFIHGALCVAWSGQCLTSEAWGQRSANRGQCAQSCRMPYDLVVDGEVADLGDVRYLLSPKDLEGTQAVPELMRLGVHGLKIEGRQKNALYAATTTKGYRNWVDALHEGRRHEGETELRDDLSAMERVFSRGFSPGFLGGSDHQSLVEGRFPKHRGVSLGFVVAVDRQEVIVAEDPEARPWTGGLALGSSERPQQPEGRVSSPLPESTPTPLEPEPGMGVVFDSGQPEDKHEPGGPVFAVCREEGAWRLGFGQPGPDLSAVRPGDRAWLTSDPKLARRTELPPEGWQPEGRIRVQLEVVGNQGQPLVARAIIPPQAFFASSEAIVIEAGATMNCDVATGAGLDRSLLESKLAAFGGTAFRCESLDDSTLSPGLHVPVRELKQLRRSLVMQMEEAVFSRSPKPCKTQLDLREMKAQFNEKVESRPLAKSPSIVPLVRNDQQLQAVIDSGVQEVILDWMEWVGLGKAFVTAKEAGLKVTIATLRIQKPAEESYDQRLSRLNPDGVLIRHWGGLMHFLSVPREARPTLFGDFSLNVTNSITAAALLSLGLDQVCVSHDLDESQLFAMVAECDASRLEVITHHRVATFHTEHCVYSHLLSGGRDYKSCGRPCEEKTLSLKDHNGLEHPILVDAGCRNTVFNAETQTCAPLVPKLRTQGISRFRLEFTRESAAEVEAAIEAWQGFLEGSASPSELIQTLGLKVQQGVSSRAMELLV